MRANNGGAGGDAIGPAAFERSAVLRIERLAAELATGRYRPGPLRSVAIPRRDGGQRILAIPCIVDRVAQTAAAQLLTPVLDPQFHRASYAYRPGRGVMQAVRAVLRHRRDGYRWTAEGDIAHCFDDIAHAPLLDALDRRVGDDRMTDLIGLWLESYAPSGIGIPQGAPISPLLCNLHLDAVDTAIDGSGLRLVRYADDFVIMAKTGAKAEAALERMAAVLGANGLALNPDKTRIVAADQGLHFLGHVFVRSMAWKEVEADNDPPAPPDAPPEDVLARWTRTAVDEAEQDEQPSASRPSRRRTLYIVEPGARLSTRNDSFMVEGPTVRGDDGELRRQGRLLEHANRIDRIEIGPGADADWAALHLAAAREVPVALVDGYGMTHAWLARPGDMRARRVMAQARWLADDSRRDRLATAIVRGRIRNQQNRVRKLNLKRRDPELTLIALSLRRMHRALPETLDPREAMPREANASKLYWQAVARCLPPSFDYAGGRDRRPPPDPVNAGLGYLAALLARDVRVAIERAGLHPGLGALHSARDDGDALVYDMMEAFRVPLVEALLMTLIGRKAITHDMFPIRLRHDDQGETRDCRIEHVARRALIQGYEATMAQTVKSRRTHKKMLWRAIMEEEARALADLFCTETDNFAPFETGY